MFLSPRPPFLSLSLPFSSSFLSSLFFSAARVSLRSWVPGVPACGLGGAPPLRLLFCFLGALSRDIIQSHVHGGMALSIFRPLSFWCVESGPPPCAAGGFMKMLSCSSEGWFGVNTVI